MKITNLIGGAEQEPAGSPGEEVFDASTARPLGQQQSSSDDQIELALNAATEVSGSWALEPGRGEMLLRCADRLEQRADEIAHLDAVQTGVLLQTTQALSRLCSASFRAAAELLTKDATDPLDGPHGPVRCERSALGPAAVIAPWNAPSGIACHKLASALAAGCPVLFKPSEWAQGSAQIIAECLDAELPDGVFQMLHGGARVGAMLVEDPRIAAVSFTGGLQGGQAVASACALQMKPAQLELGGSNPLVVLDDADLDQAAEGVVTGLITLNGQWCRAVGRVLVQQAVMEPLMDRVTQRLAELRIGPVDDPDSQMGPMVHPGHREHLRNRVDSLAAAGAEVIQPARCPPGPGWYFPPTLLTGLPPSGTREELFGPVAFVHDFSSDADAITLANDTPFGLAAYVFGGQQRASNVADRIRAGIIKINGVSLLNLHSAAPRPAWGLSGLGDEGTRETFEFFRGTRVIGSAGPDPETSS